MRKLTIKLKITLWFTIFMIILSAVVFAFIALVSAASSSSQTRGTLTSLVDNNAREVEYDDGELDIDSDFASFQNGAYCLVFDSAGAKLFGYAPYAELEARPFEDGSVRSVYIGGEAYLIYDRVVTDLRYPDIWLREIGRAHV